MSNNGEGRKIAAEWNEVANLENDTKVLCKYCKLTISRKIWRLKKNHLAKCKTKQDQTLLQNQVNNNVTETEQSRSASENVSKETIVDTEIRSFTQSSCKRKATSNFCV